MYDAQKLRRDELQDKESKRNAPDLDSVAQAPAPAADLPGVGGASNALGGGMGDKVDAAENDAARVAEQQAELARLKSLPAGDPELEAYKSPDALAAAVPGGSGPSGAAQSQAENATPKQENQGTAELGAPAQSVDASMPDIGAAAQKVEVASTIAGVGEAASARSEADAIAGKSTPEPTEAPAPQVAEPAGEKVAAEATAPLEVAAPPALAEPTPAPVDVKAEAPAEPSPSAPIEVAVPAVDAEQAAASAPEPQLAPEAAVESVAGSAPGDVAAAAPAEIAAPDLAAGAAPAAPAADVADVAAPAEAAIPEAASAAAPEVEQKAEPKAADASVAQPTAAAPTVAPATEAPAAVQLEEAPAATGEVEAPVEAPAPAPAAAAPAAATGDVAPKAGAEPAALAEGAAAAPAPVAEVAAPAIADAPVAAPNGASGPMALGAPELEGATVDTAVAGSNAAAPLVDVAVPKLALPELGADEAMAGVQAAAADVLAGREAAALQGQTPFGLTADGAAELAQLPPAGRAPEGVALIESMKEVARFEPAKELGDGGVKEALDRSRQVAAQSGADAERIAGVAGELEDHAKSMKKRVADLESLRSNPGDRVRELLGEGEGIESGLRQKAEKALDTNLSGVRVHRDKGARDVAGAMDAAAFAHGEDIVLGEADAYTDKRRELVIFEELAHVAQTKGATAARSGVSAPTDRAEKMAKAAAQRIAEGGRVEGLEADRERRAIYRNEGGSESTAAETTYPEQVVVTLGGRSVTVKLPKAPVESSKLVSLPSMNVPGLTINSNATFFFDTSTGAFKSGKTSGTVQLGNTVKTQSRDITIGKNGQMTATFQDADLRLGSLIDAHIDVSVGANGVTAHGSLGVADLKGDQLQSWLKSGTLTVDVDGSGTVSGSGSLGLEVSPFSAGKLAATINGEHLEGTVSIQQSADIALGDTARLKKGALTGKLTQSSQLEITGDLDLSVSALPNGQGISSIRWTGETQQIEGEAVFESEGENRLEPVVFSQASLSGSIADTNLKRMEGTGQAIYDDIFEGSFSGAIDLSGRKVDMVLSGGLKQPIDRAPVKISGGDLTIQVQGSALTSTAGKVDFDLDSFMKGTAVLEAGTTKDNINATATAALVAAQTFDEITLSKGAATVVVRGTSVEITGGHVDLDFRSGTATGKLDLAPSNPYEQLTGVGKAQIKAGQAFGALKAGEGAVDVDVKNQRLVSAQGNMKFATLDKFAGNLAFDARQNFATISGTASSWLTKDEPIEQGVSLKADEATQFTLQITDSAFDTMQGPVKWGHEKFEGTLNVVEPVTALNLVSGTGPADVKDRFRIGEAPGGQLYANPGSKLTGHFDGGLFQGVSGTLQWQYHQWLGGKANIEEPIQTVGIDQLSGDLSAQIIAPKLLDNGSDIRLLPGEEGSLTVRLQDGKPHQYRGTVDFRFKDFAEGKATVAGEMLDFNQLQGATVLKVVAEKAMTGQPGMTLREGGQLAATVENSTILDFTGPTQFRFGDWLEGSVAAEAGSRFFDGITGKATGTIAGTPPASTGKLEIQKGGTAKVDLTAANVPTAYEAGSQLNWKLDGWLGGSIDIEQRTAFASISGKAAGGVLEEKALDGNPGITLLPSKGLEVTFSNNTPTAFAGTTAARVQDWVEGTLQIEGVAGPTLFSGKLDGALMGTFNATDVLDLVAGGGVSVTVLANQAQDIQGEIPFKYGEGSKWLGGMVSAGTSQKFRSIQGPVSKAGVIEDKPLGGSFTLKKGGDISANMANSTISKIGGTINWEGAAGAGSAWIGGKLALEGEQTPQMFTGQMDAALLSDKDIGSNLLLKKGGSVRGTVQNNQVKTVAGSFNWQYSNWLSGVLEVTSESPLTTLGGVSSATILEEQHVQGNVYLRKGGSFQVDIANADVTKIYGEVPWRLEDWIQGVANVTDGTPTSITGSGSGTITGPGKTYREGAPEQVKLLPGGSLDPVVIDQAGEVTFSGAVNAELGKEGKTASLHMGRGGEAQAVKGPQFKGSVTGGLLSATKVPTKLALKAGGSLTARVDGDLQGIEGSFLYGFGGDEEFLVGELTVAGATTLGDVSGDVTGTISKEQKRGELAIVEGGSVYGKLLGPNSLKLEGGTFGYRYSDFLEGQIEINGSLDFSSDAGPDFSGGATGTLTRDVDVGAGFALKKGSAAEIHFQNNVADKVWGKLGFRWDKQLSGTIAVEQGASNFENVSGDATARLDRNVELGALKLQRGSALKSHFEANAPTTLEGKVGFTYDDEIRGTVQLEPTSSLESVSGAAKGTMLQRHEVPGSSFAIEPGGTLSGTLADSALSNLAGKVNWSYGDMGWLKGSVELTSGELDSVQGKVTGRIAIEKFLSEDLRLKEGGSFSADFDGTSMTGFAGQIQVVYGGWIDGAAQISGGSLEQLDGEVSAVTQTRKELGDKAFLKPGGSVKAMFAASSLQSFEGDLGWQYEQWLEGALHVDAGSTLESINGEGSATLRERKPVSDKIALERGGNLASGFAGSQWKGVKGEVTFLYEDWLSGGISVPDYAPLDSVSGKAQATLRQEKPVGSHLVLKAGGSVDVDLQNGDLASIGGHIGWRWDEWLAGSIEAQPGPLASLKGSADATIVQHKKVGADFELQPGSAILLELDAAADIAGQNFTGDVLWRWQDWLGGRVTVGAGSSFGGIQGVAEARLLADKPAGDKLVLKSGGNLQTELASSQPTTFGGEVLWHYEDWLAGNVSIQKGSTLTAISGEASAMLRQEKPIGDGGFKLRAGGSPTVVFAGSIPQTFHGHLNYGYEDWLQGVVSVEQGSSLQSVSGKGDANVLTDKPVGGKGFRVRAGSRAEIELAASQFAGLSGDLKWGWQDWVEGSVHVEGSKLENVDGEAKAQIVADKKLGSKFTLKPGGAAEVTLQGGDVTAWGGKVKVQYEDLLLGSLSIANKGPIENITGEVDARLLRAWDVAPDVKLLAGGGIKASFSAGGVDRISGRARFQYSDWLDGVVDIDPSSTLGDLGGHVTAMLAKDKALGSSGLTLRQGGNLTARFDKSQFQDVAGRANWKYDGGKAKLDGSITLEPSTLESISGDAIAHLSEPMEVGNGLKLLRGGDLQLRVQDSKPGTFSGRVNWQLEDWISGSVELASGTGFDGPYSGGAEARLLKTKDVGSKVQLRKGGHLEFDFDSSKGLADSRFNGNVALDYDRWLRGTIDLDNTSFTSLSGSAKVQLLAGKDLGSSGIKLLKGSNATITLQSNELTGIEGLVRWRYEEWLEGSLDVVPGSTPDSISGEANATIRKEKAWGKLKLLPGSGLTLSVQNNDPGAFRGTAIWQYEDWLAGSLDLDERTTKDSFYGQGAATLQNDKKVGEKITLKAGGGGMVQIQASEVKTIGGTLQIGYEDWIEGQVTVQGQGSLDSIDGTGQIVLTQDKQVGKAKLKQGSGLAANFASTDLADFRGNATVDVLETYRGTLELDAGSNVDSVSGYVEVGLIKDKPVGNKIVLKQGGNIHATFDGTDLQQVGGQVALEYDGWLRGRGDMQTGTTLDQFVGSAQLEVVQPKTFKGGIELGAGSFLRVEFDQSGPTLFAGNVDVQYEDWLQGNLNFEAQSLDSITGSGSLYVIEDKQLINPLSVLKGSWLKAWVKDSELESFGGVANLAIDGWGTGKIAVREGSTTEDITGEAQFNLEARKEIGSKFALTGGSLGAEVQSNELKKVWGEARGEVKDLGEGWIRIERSSTLEVFTGQAGVRLTKPQKIGSFAQLSGGEVLANFEQNALTTFGGWAEIEVFEWGTGRVEIESTSTADNLSGQANIALTHRKELAGGKVIITAGEASATVKDNTLTQMGGMIEVELKDIAKGRVAGTLDVQKEEFTGGGSVQQIKEWRVGPAAIRDGKLEANVVKNKLASAAGSATIDAGKFGKGTIEVNFIDQGDAEPTIYGRASLEFQPHDRMKGRLDAQITEDKKFVGEGTVSIKISDKITGEAGVALREDGHVVLKGAVRIPGPIELFKADPYKKDLTLLDTGFMVYTPPTVKVNVGAGLGLEAGIKPLVISNIVLSGQCDLMEPSFASLAVTGHMSSSAYVDLNAWIEGSVSVSAAVVAVEAGLRAALNLHLEAAISADPTITVNRNGLSFDMPVRAELIAALNLILTFFAKVRVGIDVGLFSIMKTVWRYDVSPDPLKLASMSIGANGHVHAGPDGFSATMDPQYQPPDMSIEGLKRALKI
ncbi:MAG: hypothetical protein RIT45_458 [Pseudomonadota bacterium]